MADPGFRLLRLACVTLALTANCTERAPYSSRVVAVLAPCLVGLAIVVMLGLALAVAKLRERRQTEGGFSPPSRQEKEGSRVEMWSITQPPPMERLI
uniref:Uncharacterized protein n=1 Tax=Sander lucioperca TaxID=283035 RepID=A0A8C9YN63_SANLU